MHFHKFKFLFFIFRANNAKINFREKEKKVLDQILGQGKYDARIRPSGINGTGELFPFFIILLQIFYKYYNLNSFTSILYLQIHVGNIIKQ